MTKLVRSLPHPADFPAPPSDADRARWAAADAARPGRFAWPDCGREWLREGVDAYFGIRPEHMRYLTGFALEDGEDRVAGNSGRFLVSAGSGGRSGGQPLSAAGRGAGTGARIEATTTTWPGSGRAWSEEPGGAASGRRIGPRQPSALGPARGRGAGSSWSRPRLGRGGPSRQGAVGDRADQVGLRRRGSLLAAILRRIKPGQTERELALVSSGRCAPAAPTPLPSVSPAWPARTRLCRTGRRPAARSASARSCCSTSGRIVDGYRSDMTRTLFVGSPGPRRSGDLRDRGRRRRPLRSLCWKPLCGAEPSPERPSGRRRRAAGHRGAGHGDHFGHGTGHGIGLATHELPSLSRAASDDPLPSPTVFSVEPGIYLDGETGVRIEDLVLFDRSRRDIERLTGFTRDVLVVGV
jgi:hypothetical protein